VLFEKKTLKIIGVRVLSVIRFQTGSTVESDSK
jgi:hypothetical protein